MTSVPVGDTNNPEAPEGTKAVCQHCGEPIIFQLAFENDLSWYHDDGFVACNIVFRAAPSSVPAVPNPTVSVTLTRREWATVLAALSMRVEADQRLAPIRDQIAARQEHSGFDPGAEWTRLGMRNDGGSDE